MKLRTSRSAVRTFHDRVLHFAEQVRIIPCDPSIILQTIWMRFCSHVTFAIVSAVLQSVAILNYMVRHTYQLKAMSQIVIIPSNEPQTGVTSSGTPQTSCCILKESDQISDGLSSWTPTHTVKWWM